MNPYAAHLGDRDPFAAIAATAAELARRVAALDAGAADRRPAAGKWSVREVICHLADSEVVFAFRLRQAAAREHHIIDPFEQDDWARSYAAYDVETALAVFTAVRRWNILFIAAQPPATFQKSLTHPERGAMTFRVLVETMGGHDLNHIAQLGRITG
jgi:uncharacterized damage-inducible protein DinB